MTEIIINRIDYREIAELDLDSIAHIPDEELAQHFSAMAEKATAGQLNRFLESIPGVTYVSDDEVEEKAELVRQYVERRLKVVRDLRSKLTVFSGVLDALDRF